MKSVDSIVDQKKAERSRLGDAESIPVESKAQLVEYLESGCKAPELFALGTEQEQFVYHASDFRPAAYDGPEPGIKALLESMSSFGWQPIEERGLPIAAVKKNRTITLEPGGQIELSGAALGDAHQTFQETKAYHRELEILADQLGLRFLALGHQPKHTRKELPWMPKQRYRIMRDYMPKYGSLGLDMMQSTCALQVTADFADEADMVKKYRVALALQPVATALFANSPFAEGKFSGYLSNRSFVWSDTDPGRCGSLPFVFETGMGFERYTDYALDVPMYFVCRDGKYIDASGLSFCDFLAGQLAVLPGQRPMLSDWEDHLTTVFPQVRLKHFLEMRGADAGPISRVAALPALWAGLLYDAQSLDAAWERIGTWTPEERYALEREVAKHGFRTPFRNGTVQELALWILELARQGLQRRGYRNQYGQDESCYLEPLQEAAQSGQTFGEALLRRFQGQWMETMNTALPAMCEETFR
ncbi:Glutamate--cysteine ligase GshA [Planctomycetes bacterium MalM25]|nr:Glutamate--cysteine ligase GshA [Planctomycetes bacterium MalM25]